MKRLSWHGFFLGEIRAENPGSTLQFGCDFCLLEAGALGEAGRAMSVWKALVGAYLSCPDWRADEPTSR